MSILEGWMAARVVRKHTLPYLRAENLAEHTWGVLHTLLCIYPHAPIELIRSAMYHDIGEHRSGDIPGDFKAAHPEIRDASEGYEDQAARTVLPDHLHDALTPTREHVLLIKIADKIEFAFSCYHEWMLGNKYSVSPMGRTIEMAREAVRNSEALYTGLPESVQMNIHNLLNEATRLYSEARGTLEPHREINYASE